MPPHNLQLITEDPGEERAAANARPRVIIALEQQLLHVQGADSLRGKGFVEMQQVIQGALEHVASMATSSRELGMLAELVADITAQLYVRCMPSSSPSGVAGGGVGGGAGDEDGKESPTSTTVMTVVMECIAKRYPQQVRLK